MNLKTGLLIAGGIAGAVGLGYMFMNKDKGTGDEMAPGPDGELTPEQAAAQLMANGQAGDVPTAGTPGAAGPGAPGADQAPGMGQGMAQGQPQARQVGPYTVVPDPQSGVEIVFETATQQPVGVLDAQGNLQPIVVDAQGNASLAQAPQAGLGTGAGVSSAGMPGAGAGAALPQAQAGAAQYAPLAEALFADAGAAMSAPAAAVGTGVGALTPQPQLTQAPMPAGLPQTQSMGQGQAQSPVPTMGQGQAAAGVAAAGAQQVGAYTVIPDSSGMQLVLETATQQPVGVIDQQGNMIPVTVDAAGNLSLAQTAPQGPAVAPQAQAPAAAAAAAAPVSVPQY